MIPLKVLFVWRLMQEPLRILAVFELGAIPQEILGEFGETISFQMTYLPAVQN